MRDDLSGLRAFLRVAQKRSFRAAAAELRVTPSAVSQSVRALEQRLGVRLLQRTTRSVGLTEAGARFAASLKPALDGVDAAVESLGALRGRPTGLLRLTALRSGYEDVLRPKLAQFLAAYPDVRIDLSVDEKLVDVVAEGFDAGLRLGQRLDREMIGVRVSADQQVVVVGAPRYFARRGKPSHPRELHAHDCITLRMPTRGTVNPWRFQVDRKPFEIAVDGSVVTNDGAVLVDAAVEGLGLALRLRGHGDRARLAEAPGARAPGVLPADSRILPVLPEPREPRAQAEGARRVPQEQVAGVREARPPAGA